MDGRDGVYKLILRHGKLRGRIIPGIKGGQVCQRAETQRGEFLEIGIGIDHAPLIGIPCKVGWCCLGGGGNNGLHIPVLAIENAVHGILWESGNRSGEYIAPEGAKYGDEGTVFEHCDDLDFAGNAIQQGNRTRCKVDFQCHWIARIYTDFCLIVLNFVDARYQKFVIINRDGR